MLVFQALLELLRRSAGKVFQSLFGWAVNALFGSVRDDEKARLAAAVGGAAVWPILAAGAVFPRVAAFVVAFIPIPKGVPDLALRIAWIVLAVGVPFFVGAVVARHSERRYTLANSFQGFPITLGLAAAFTLAFIVVPIRKFQALVRGEKAQHLPLIVESEHRATVDEAILSAVAGAGLPVEPRPVPWLDRTIASILRATAAAAGEREAGRARHFEGHGLDLTIHPNGVDLRGRPSVILRAHALITEKAAFLPALQTSDPKAQELEKKVRSEWRSLARTRAAPAPSVRALARDLTVLDCGYEDWETVYRQVLQLQLARSGAPQLLESVEREDLRLPSRRRRGTLARARRGSRETVRVARGKALSGTADSIAKLLEGLTARAIRALRRGRRNQIR